MTVESSARPDRSAAVSVLGLGTLLLGGAYGALGSQLILAGATWAERAGDPWGPVITLFGLGPALVIAVGVAFLPLSILGLLAGAGIVLRKQAGRILAFVFAVLVILLGLIWATGGDQDAMDIALGAGQVLYGILAFVLLIRMRGEFSGLRVPTP